MGQLIFNSPGVNLYLSHNMNSQLVVLLSLALLVTLFMPVIEGAAVRRRGRQGRKTLGRQRLGRQRQGRQETEEAGSELPNGCDELTEIGAFMNHLELLRWCIDVGEIDPETQVGLYKPLLALLEAKDAAKEEAAE